MSTEREIGELCARVDALERTVESMDAKLTQVRDTLLRAEGSWRFMVGLAGFSATLGGLITALGIWLWPRT
ncbi:MAG: hypothetical protein J0H94_04465 [Rhizobiales bacterium]|nr:hypothetical protein [Hyphomicrobiales bacterium]